MISSNIGLDSLFASIKKIKFYNLWKVQIKKIKFTSVKKMSYYDPLYPAYEATRYEI